MRLACFVLGSLLLGCGCSDDGVQPASLDAAPDGTAGGVGGSWTWDAGGTTGGGPASGGNGGTNPACPPLGLPKEVPAGFIEYGDYSCACRFYVPGPSAAPVAPVEWEACPQPGPSNSSCRRMTTPWTDGKSIGTFPRFWFDRAANKAYLQFGRLLESMTVRHKIVADVDGPVINAIYEIGPACVLYDGGIQGDRYLFPVVSETHGTEGFIGGKLGEMPDIAFKQPLVPGSHTSWRMTSEWVIRWHDQLAVRRWADTTEFPIQPGTAPYDIKGTGGDVFFRVGSFVGAGVMTWSESKGARDLIRYPNAPERGAANFGTDGVDMVWTYGEGLPSRSSQWLVTRSIMTAPYSTDADTVAKTARRLRSDQHLPAMMDGFAVGCGYAARNFYQPLGDSSHANTLLIVRLSDGVSWSVTMPSTKSGAQLTHALGVTCEEVFSKAQFPDESSAVVRIRLDSLGPGMPPD